MGSFLSKLLEFVFVLEAVEFDVLLLLLLCVLEVVFLLLFDAVDDSVFDMFEDEQAWDKSASEFVLLDLLDLWLSCADGRP